MSLIDDFANSNLVQSVRQRFVPLTGGDNPPANPTSARADAMAPIRTPPTPSSGVFGQPEIPTLTHPLRDPQMNTQPGNALARATGETGEVGYALERQARLAGNGSLATPGNEINVPGPQSPGATRAAFGAQPGQGLVESASAPRAPGAGPALPDPVNATRAAFNTQPGQGFADASGMTNPGNGPDPYAERMARVAAESRAAAGPTGVQAGSLDEALRAATLRNGAQPGEALAGRIAGGPPPGAVGVGGGAGGAGIPPGGAIPGAAAGGEGWYGRFTNAASEAMRPTLPSLGTTGNGLIAKAAGATVGAGAALLKKASPWVAPVMEGMDVATVALDPNSSKADVVEQAGAGTARAGSAAIGATLGGMAGAAVGGPLAPVTGLVGGLAGGVAGYMGGDAGIRKMREWMGLPSELPAERAKARAQVPQMMEKIDTANKSVANDAAANKIMDDPTGASQQALVDAFKPQGKQAPATAAAPAAPGTAPAPQQAGAPAPAAPQPSAMQLAALQAQQEQSPIAFTTMGGGQAPQVFYKDGSMGTLQAGQQMPADVAEFNARHQQINALMTGRPAPGAAPAAPQGTPQGAPQGSQTAGGYVPFSHIGDANLRRHLQIYGGATAMAEGGDYNKIVGGGTFNDFSKHPGVVGLTTKDGPSTAGGRYMITGTTWGDVSKQKNLADFSPKNQDDAFIALLERRGALADVAAGNYDAATAKLGQEWQGLPSGASKNQGKRTPEQFAKMLADARAQADAYGAAPAQAEGAAAAAPAPATGSGALSMQEPVHLIKGMDQFTAMPTGGPMMQNVPQSIVDAGRQAGNVQGAVNQFMGNVNQGMTVRANPTAGKLAEEAVKGEYANTSQRIAATGQVAGHVVAADASRDVAKIGQGNQRYMTAGGGVDPNTMMPAPTVVFDKQEGRAVNTAKPTYPIPPKAAIEQLKKDGNAPQFDAVFGPGAAEKYKGK
jgi:muramidase (phage lysozyme)